MARDTVDPAIKAAALADLHNGDQPAIVAERYGLDPGKVRMWKTRYVAPSVADSATSRVAVIHRPALEMQQLELGELVMMNLRAKLIATQRIAEYVTTPDWIDKQGAADVAELFEVLDRSAISILDRLAQRGHADSHAERADSPAPDADS